MLADVDLRVEPGEVVAILGTSGCGKSTLLRIAGGLDSPTSGACASTAAPVAGIDARCAVAFQEPRLLPWRTIADNVALGLPRGTPRAAARPASPGCSTWSGSRTSPTHRPREVSGGMAQRASLARALARRPGVLLLDEPFGALDALTRLRMQDLLLDVHAAQPTTVLLVTHDVDEALQLADRIVLLGRGDGAGAASIRQIVTVPGGGRATAARPSSPSCAASLLDGLGIDRHGPPAGSRRPTPSPLPLLTPIASTAPQHHPAHTSAPSTAPGDPP